MNNINTINNPHGEGGFMGASSSGTFGIRRESSKNSQRSEADRMVSTEMPTDKRSTYPPGIARDHGVSTARKMNTDIPHILPHERVFPIQIGSELFKLSGASISSDAPSYFSQFFKCQLETAKENGDDTNSVRTLYIDRDPVTFKEISLHLQGYHVGPKDGRHFVRLFADALFYSLPRLVSQLYEERIFISIGHRDFQIPHELFSDPGNSPNYFSLGFAVFFSTPTELFPGLNREGLLRPPSILPPSIPNRSAETFAELLHLLRGYPLQIKNADHRAELLRDCRYFHLKGLEQKLIRHEISFNLARKRSEIILCLDDVRQSGISVVADPTSSPPPDPQIPVYSAQPGAIGYVNYARPFVDTKPYELILETGSEETKLHLGVMRAEFFGQSKARVSRLFEVIATKLNLPTTKPLGLLMKQGGASSQPASPENSGVSQDLVRVIISDESWIQLDGKEWKGQLGADEAGSATPSVAAADEWAHEPPTRKRRRIDISSARGEEWVVKTGQWRLRVQNARDGKGGVECVLIAVKIDAFSAELGRNALRGFLAG